MDGLFSQIGLRDRKVILAEESEVVFRQAQPVFGVGLVQTGAVELLRHTESGMKVKVSTARSGETFAEASVFSDVYHCDCVAQRPSKVTLYRAEGDSIFCPGQKVAGRGANTAPEADCTSVERRL